MKAINFVDFNRMQVESVPVPALAEPDDVLVRVRAAGVCGSDLHGYTGQSGRRQPPLIMGHEVAGEVVAVGPAVTTAAPGDRVAIQPLVYRPDPATGQIVRKLIGMHLPGAYAEYVIAPAGNLYPMTDSLTYAAGAMTEPLAVCVHAVSLVHVRPYDSVLVVGAGTIGLLTMLVLKLAGARQIVMSDVSDARLQVASALGASAVINPAASDFDESVAALTGGAGFDVTFEAVGISATVQQAVRAVKGGGTVVWIGNNQRIVEVDMQSVVTREVSILGSYGMNARDFQRSLAMLADGCIPVDQVITRRAALDEGATLFDELLADPTTIKCVIEMA